jgi:hypothetical protein
MPIRLALPALLASLLLAAVPSAVAGGPGKWTEISPNDEDNIDEVALARTNDGVLHAIFVLKDAHDLDHVAISPSGVASAPNAVTTGWATIDTVPDLAVQPDGTLRAFFGGIHSTDTNDPNNDFNTATAPASGAAWSLFRGPIIKGDAAYGSDAGAALEGDGTPLISFGGTGTGTFVHRGLDPATPNFKVTTPTGGCCTYNPDVAVDQSGAAYVAFFSNATPQDEGTWVQGLAPATGQPIGVPVRVPGSSVLSGGIQQSVQPLMRTQITARVGGGVWVAGSSGYPTATRPFVWKIGTSSPIPIAKTKGGDAATAIAADPDGRLWAFWVDRTGGSPKVFARRSSAKNPAKFGPAVALGSPKGMESAYRLEGNASSGALDVVVEFGNVQGIGHWHTQALAGLALSASPSKIKGGKSTAVKFTVSDPDPVKGATVSAGGKSAKTDAKGHATIDLGPTKKKSIAASATKKGYTKGTLKLKVKH